MQILLFVLALLIGCAATLQGATNATLAGRSSLATAVFINALVLTVVAGTVWLVTRRSFASHPASPWYLYLGGIYGVFIIAGAAFAFPRFGAGPTTALMMTAQLCTALVLDHLGLPGGRIDVTPARLLGACLLLAGALLVLWPKLGR
jgi:bacterial/archaeal transporter family-2 protein